MPWISVDVEASGQTPGKFSMLSLGACVVEYSLDRSFYAEFTPLEGAGADPAALEVCGFTLAGAAENGTHPADAMALFAGWVDEVCGKHKPMFISDNPGFDFSFVNYYFGLAEIENPFGWSSRRISDLWCGYQNDPHASWKHFRTTAHTHRADDDARGNAEALIEMKSQGLNIPIH